MDGTTISGIILPVSLNQLEGMITDAVKKGATAFNQVFSAAEEEEFISFREACIFLKMKPGTLYYLTANDKIPFIKKGKLLTFSKGQLRTWLLDGQNTGNSSKEEKVDQQIRNARKRKITDG